MRSQAQNLVREIEDIKSRLIDMEVRFMESEEPEEEDAKAVEEALEEYRKGATTSHKP